MNLKKMRRNLNYARAFAKGKKPFIVIPKTDGALRAAIRNRYSLKKGTPSAKVLAAAMRS